MSEPITRSEMYLAALGGEAVTPPAPITRMDMYLAYLNGMTDTYPEPITRTEQYLFNICQNGGMGGGGGVTIRNQNKTITENGTYRHDTGYTGLGTVTVNVPQEDPVLQDKTVTENGTVTADAGFDGLGVVTVNVAASGGGSENEDALVTRTATEYTNNRVEEIGTYLFYNVTSIKKATFKNAKKIQKGAFEGSGVEIIDAPAVEALGGYSFQRSNITSISLPVCSKVDVSEFSNCKKLTHVNLPAITDALRNSLLSNCSALESFETNALFVHGSVFVGCTSLITVDFTRATNIYERVFQNCAKLDAVILRNDSVCSLGNVNSFDGTPFATGGTGGTVYVPSALISEYQAATNWSTLYAAGTCNFVAIEGSEYE